MSGPNSSSGSSSTSGTAQLKTLLLSDLVDSTRLVEKLGDLRAAELSARHDRLARALLERFGGREIDKTDGFLLLFERPIQAVGFALAYHEALAKLALESGAALAARVGVHVGEVYLRENPPDEIAQGAKPVEVEGLAKPLAARLMGLARGGQTLLSRGAFDLARRASADAPAFGENLKWLAHGSYQFKGFDEAFEVFEVGVEGWAPLAPPTTSDKARRVGSEDTVLGWRPAPGLVIPHRPNWTLERKLGEGGFGEVWLAEQRKTHERRVFKFCFELERVRALQREVTVCRLLREALGNRPDISRILDWNFDEAPFFLEFEYTEGGNLAEWVELRGGFAEIPLATRLEVAAQVADAIAAAHSIGVLHKDVKPANILVHDDASGGSVRPFARVTDFGIGVITDGSRLADFGITVLGATELASPGTGTQASGTRIYMAPEVLEGKPTTTLADVYSLGVLIFQLAVGDFSRTLAPGWERDIDDEILREDLALFLDGHPERRLASAAEVGRRLRSRDDRRRQREEERRLAAEADANRRSLEKNARRRKFAIAAAVILALFAAGTAIQARRVAREAARANREAAAAQQVTDFMIKLFEVSDPSEAKGNSVTAREILDRGAGEIDKELAAQPVVQAKMMDAIGTVYLQLGLREPAGKLLTRAWELRRKTLGENDPETANSVHDLGWLAEKTGDNQQAEKRYLESLAVRRAVLAPDDPAIAKNLDDLGWIYVEQARFDEALPLIREALAMRERRFGAESSETASSLETLAYVHFQRGQFGEAAEILRRVLAIKEKLEGVDSFAASTAANNLAVQLREIGKTDEALALYRRSLAIQTKILGPDHPDLGSIYNNIATLTQDTADMAGAEALFRKALAVREKALGENHPLTGLSLNNLASCLWKEGKIDEAAALWTRALASREASLGKEHPQVAVTVTNLGLLAFSRGDLALAEKHFLRSIAIAQKAFGGDQPAMLGALVGYETLLRYQHRLSEADAIAARIASVRKAATDRGEKLVPPPIVRLPNP